MCLSLSVSCWNCDLVACTLTRDQEAIKKLRDCQESLASSEEENAALKKQAEDHTKMIANLEDDIKLGMDQLKAKNAEIDALKKNVTELEHELKKLCEQVAALTEERDKLALEGAVSADLEAELKELREQLAALQEERDRLTKEGAMLAVTRSELESKTAEAEAAKAALKDAQDEVERLKKLLADKEAAPKHLEDREKIFGLQRALELATMTMEEVAKEHLADHTCVSSAAHSSNTTVGLSFDSKNATVSGVLVGGPAFNSKQVHKDDVIMAVDGQAVQGNQILDLLKGVDKPGSVVTLTLMRTSVSASSFGMLSPPLPAE